MALVAGLCVQKPEGIEPTPLQPVEELKLSDFPEAFKSTLIVVGDNTSDIEMQAANEIAEYLENETGNKPLIKKHSEISDEDKRNYNLIIVGTPKTNPFLEEVYALTNATRVTEEFPGEGEGVLEILPNPWDESKAMLLVEGWDEWGIRDSITITTNLIEKSDKKRVIQGKDVIKTIVPSRNLQIWILSKLTTVKTGDQIEIKSYIMPLINTPINITSVNVVFFDLNGLPRREQQMSFSNYWASTKYIIVGDEAYYKLRINYSINPPKPRYFSEFTVDIFPLRIGGG